MSRRLLDAWLGRPTVASVPLSRREVLRLGLASAAGLLSGSGRLSAAGSARARVIVVGAGFAGLACAYELLAAGYDVRVFEARGRVGGRVMTLPSLVPGKPVEAGGELLGANHPTVLAYAAKFGLELRPVSEFGPEQIEPLVLDGRRIDTAEAERLGAEVEAALARMTLDARTVDPDEPWKSPQAELLDRRSTAEWIEQQSLSPSARVLIAAQLTANNGVAVARQSYLGNLSQVRGGGLEQYWTDTEAFRCATGNQQFAEKLAESIGAARISLGCAVRRIVSRGNSISVQDSHGCWHECDDLVLAVPPTIWKHIRFDPELPAAWQTQMGTAVKFLAVLDRPFWTDEQLAPTGFSNGDISYTWESTDGQAGAASNSVVLTAFSGGPAAEHCRRRTPAARQQAYLSEFERLFPGFSRHFRCGAFFDWPGEPWTLAGYSFPAPGQITQLGSLYRNGYGRLHFAGEHTCYKFVGYMEGGLNSGASLAQRIAARDGVVRTR